MLNNNNNNSDLNSAGNNLNSDINAHRPNASVVEPPKRPDIPATKVPTPKRLPEPAVGGAGAVLTQDNGANSDNIIDNKPPSQLHDDNDNNNDRSPDRNGRDEVPDAPHEADNGNTNAHHNVDGLSDEFRRGLIKKVQGQEESNLNNVPVQHNAFPPEQPVREIGGMHINWDWDDFSITFQNYGAAEMKVGGVREGSFAEVKVEGWKKKRGGGGSKFDSRASLKIFFFLKYLFLPLYT